MPLPAGTRLGAYEIVGLLGAGGMGEVYRARDSRLKRDVALKILPASVASDADRLARFQREAEVLASLNHPHIAQIYGLEHDHDQRALAMELVEGEDLADRIAHGALQLDDVLAIGRQIADALEAAHDRGIVHRDLKPANIKVRADGTVKVLDFGLAKALDQSAGSGSPTPGSLSMSPTIVSPAMTQVGFIIGTAAYMAPEQARGKSVDKRADIWAFGCVLYEMLTGRRAFEDEDVSLTLSKVLQREPDWSLVPATTPGPIRQLLRRCLEKDPRRRVRDIGEAWSSLEASLAETAGSERATVGDRSGTSNRTVTAVIVTVVLLATIIAGTFIWMSSRTAVPAALPAHLAIALPAAQRISLGDSVTMSTLAVSPDGRQIAYVANDRLFLKSMDADAPVELPGSGGANAPFFSPDGRQVGFFAAGKLKRASVGGGTAEPICDVPIGLGGSWAAGDTIFYAPSNLSGIWKVGVGGGVPEAVTELDRAKGEVSHRWPQILPGGKGILFTVWHGPGWDEMDLQLQILATGERRLLVRGGQSGQYVATGHLVYQRAGELTAVPFDLERLEAGTMSKSLGIKVEYFERAEFGVSDSGLLAYVSGHSQFERRVTWLNRAGTVEPLEIPLRAYEDALLSPDGKQVAMTVSGAHWGISIYDLTNGTQRLLTSTTESSQWPVWTADGKRVIYRLTREGRRNLFWRNVDGSGEEERLTTSDHMQTATSVSPDGRWLAFQEIDPVSADDIWILPLDKKSAPRPFVKTTADEIGAVFSPDGAWLAYYSSESGQYQVSIQAFPGPGARTVVSPRGGRMPRWSADGRELFYLEGNQLIAVSVTPGSSISTGSPRVIATKSDADAPNGYDVGRDGRFLMVRPVQSEDVFRQINVVINWFDELKRLLAK